MTIYSDPIEHYSRRRFAAAAAGTIFSLAVAFLAIWQISLHNGRGSVLGPERGRTPALTQRSNDAPPAAAPTVAPAASGAVPGSSSAAASAAGTVVPQVIIVDSDAQAKVALAALNQADLLRSQTGGAPYDFRVIVASNDIDFETAVKAITDENSTRTLLGLPEIEIQDLRAAPPAH